MYQIIDPYGYGSGPGNNGGSGPGNTNGGGDVTGGTDPTHPPTWTPGGNGWWSFFDGMWRWMSDPVPPTVRQPAP